MLMKTSKLIVCLVLPMIILLFISCGGEQSDWKKAKKSDTVEAYDTFIKKNPQSNYIRQAYIAMEISFLKKNNFFFEPISFRVAQEVSNVKIMSNSSGNRIEVKDPDTFQFLILTLKFTFKPDDSIVDKNNVGYGSRQIIANYIHLNKSGVVENNSQEQVYPALGFNFHEGESEDRWLMLGGDFMHALYLKPGRDRININFYKFLFRIPRDLDRFSIYYRDQCVKKDIFLKRAGTDTPVPSQSNPIKELKIEKPVEGINFPQQSKSSPSEEKSIKKKKKKEGVVTGIIDNASTPPPPIRLPFGQKPVILKQVPPEYPEAARKNRISGMVVLHVTVDTAGKVENIKIISGPSQLYQSTTDAVKQWLYEPFKQDGQPRSFIYTLSVMFRLQ
jgi:TonB family protein